MEISRHKPEDHNRQSDVMFSFIIYIVHLLRMDRKCSTKWHETERKLKYFLGNQMKVSEMAGICITHGEMRNAH